MEVPTISLAPREAPRAARPAIRKRSSIPPVDLTHDFDPGNIAHTFEGRHLYPLESLPPIPGS